MVKYKAAVLITSDTCHIEPGKDLSGPYIQEQLRKLTYIKFDSKIVVSDDKNIITNCISTLVRKGVHLIITSGGTGLCPRDQTPDVCESLYDRACPGIAIALINKGLQNTPHAALSRLTAGIIGKTLVVNFPGKLKACQECFETLETILEHALDQIIFDQDAITRTHNKQDHSEGDSAQIDKSSDHTLGESQKFTNHTMKTGQSIESSYESVEYEKALETLKLQSSSSLYTSNYSLLHSDEHLVQALGRILAEDLKCSTMSPSYAVSMMDGYVLNVSDWMKNKIKSMGTINASLVRDCKEFELLQDSKDKCNSFFCHQVNTGGRIPRKHFAIIPFEHTGSMRSNDTIPIYKVEMGKYIREMGSDLNASYIIKKGTECGPIELSMILSMNKRGFLALKAPTIGIISTGDEIKSAFDNHADHSDESIIDINNPLLRCLFKKNGLESVNLGIVKDDPVELESFILNGLKNCDILLITGGASMGTRDYVKSIIEKSLNGSVQFGRVNIKPGKPAGYATIEGYRAKHIFSLPGNPVSAYMTSLVLVLPFIKFCKMRYFNEEMVALENKWDILGTQVEVEIGELLDIEEGKQCPEFDGRLEFVRAKWEPQTSKVSVSVKQQSSRLLSLSGCNSLILIEPSMKGSKFQIGQKYKAILLDYPC